jgi:hypothetical protein
MNQKTNLKQFYYFIFICLILVNSSKLFSQETNPESSENITNISDTDIDNISIADIEELEKEERGTRNISDDELMIQVLDIAKKINTPIWRITNPPKGRDTLYLIPQRLSAIEYGGLALNLFFNYTPKMDFSPDETLKLDENQEALDAIVNLLNTLLSSEEASSLIPLFKKFTIQERKVGALLQLGVIVGAFTFQINTALQYAERNFWLDEKYQKELKQMFAGSGDLFDKNEMYRSNFGLGDTRLKLGVNTLNTSSFQMDVGFEGIVPTSKISSKPRLKEYEINLENFEDCLPNVMKAIRDNLITPQLGNNGHFGLGCYMETKVDLFHDVVHLWNRLSFDNLFEANENRLILSKQTIPAPGKDPEYFEKNILLPAATGDFEPATDFIKQYLLPPAYKVNLKPGGILNFIAALSFDLSRKWTLGVGYDYYMQQREHFKKILTNKVDPSNLRINDAEQPRSDQHKLFAEINHFKRQPNWNLNFGLGGDYTISSEEMGHDWTVFLRVGFLF